MPMQTFLNNNSNRINNSSLKYNINKAKPQSIQPNQNRNTVHRNYSHSRITTGTISRRVLLNQHSRSLSITRIRKVGVERSLPLRIILLVL